MLSDVKIDDFDQSHIGIHFSLQESASNRNDKKYLMRVVVVLLVVFRSLSTSIEKKWRSALVKYRKHRNIVIIV